MARFQSDFDALSGCLYHLGNTAFAGRSEGAFFAYEVLSAASRHQDPRSFLAPLGLADFWNLHDSRTLLLNAAYPIVK